MIKERENYSKLTNNLKDHSTKCCICKTVYEEVDVKVKHHHDVTEKIRVSAHKECHLNLSLSKRILFVFHNMQTYDSHLNFQTNGKYNFKKCHAKNK